MPVQTLRPTSRQDGPRLEMIKWFRPAPWCHSRRKRCFDLVVATVLLIPVIPLIPLIILLIKLESPGPALFIRHRAGMGGKDFLMFKFRTMEHEKNGSGVSLTRAGDLRVTRVGRLLRKWKLDEVPQLWNVFRGEMSIVGPRPHVRRLLGDSSKVRDFLSIRPGMTSLASIHFRHEEVILPRIPEQELEAYYIQNILPRKMQLDMDYAARASCWSDVKLLLSTFREVVLPHGFRKNTQTLAQLPLALAGSARQTTGRKSGEFARRESVMHSNSGFPVEESSSSTVA